MTITTSTQLLNKRMNELSLEAGRLPCVIWCWSEDIHWKSLLKEYLRHNERVRLEPE